VQIAHYGYGMVSKKQQQQQHDIKRFKTKGMLIEITFQQEIAMHAVNMKVCCNGFPSSNKSLTNNLATKYIFPSF